jgi:hypothetical protein
MVSARNKPLQALIVTTKGSKAFVEQIAQYMGSLTLRVWL